MINTITFQNHISQLINKLFESDRNAIQSPSRCFIIALSGGADSVFLLHQLVELQKSDSCSLIVAHLNHGWRGGADQEDQQFCQQLAEQYNVSFVTTHAEDIKISKHWNGSQEELGRYQRHAFLQEVATQHNASGIFLGHQADDQIETFFIRLLRGASLEGLSSMREIEYPRQGIPLLRPLLNTHRTDIEQWLSENNYSWHQDSDNEHKRFLRNRIRIDLLPMIHLIDPRFKSSFARTIKQLQQESDLIEEFTQNTFTQIFDEAAVGNLTQFKQLNPMLQGHLLKKLFIKNNLQFSLSASFIAEALRFLNTPQGGTHALGKTWAIQKKSQSFYLINISERPS
ncbi:tRNA lysidine(34) synthetase TilS [Candidatus Dependentiae bacterium]|nr:tRNA lysidine(34) synthetase TilS [Candidatus Dependentiae bacterium]